MTTALETLTRIASDILCVPADQIDPDADVETLGMDDDDWRDALEQAAGAHGAPLSDILNSMPVYRIKRGDMAMASLVDLAAFSPRASAMLAEFTTQMHLDTLRSLAASIDAGRYVPSGRMSDDIHRPNTPTRVIAKGAGIWSAAFGLPLLNAFGPCNPICQNCFAAPGVKFWEIAVYSLPLATFACVLWLGPGCFELWDDIRKQNARKRMRAAQAAPAPSTRIAATPEPE